MPLSANLVSSQRQPLFPVSFLCIFQQAYFNKYTKFDANHGILLGYSSSYCILLIASLFFFGCVEFCCKDVTSYLTVSY